MPSRPAPFLNLINQSQIRMPRQWMVEVDSFLRKKLRLGSRELTIVFLDPNEARQINQRYRKKDYPTDVLSFDGTSGAELGELVICPQVLQRQAIEHDLSFRAELAYMLIHGVLHLLGMDHEKSEAEAQRMFQIQDQLFDRLCAKFHI